MHGDLVMWLLLALAAVGGSSSPPATPRGAPGRRRWVWPLPRLADGRRPVVSDPYGPSPGRADGFHGGVDLMYVRPVKLAPLPKSERVYPDHGSAMFELPAGTPVVAASDGKVWSTAKSDLGWSIVIGHGPDTRYATQYLHLEDIAIPEHARGKLRDGGGPGMVVRAGEVIGTAGHSLRDGAQIRHVHFELRDGRTPIDPGSHKRGHMKSWEII